MDTRDHPVLDTEKGVEEEAETDTEADHVIDTGADPETDTEADHATDTGADPEEEDIEMEEKNHVEISESRVNDQS